MSNADSIVVTGCGLIGPFGFEEADLASALRGERDCFGRCSLFETKHRVAEVRDFRVADHVRSPKARRAPRISQFALVAATRALKQAGFSAKTLGGEETALVYGTGNGPAAATERSLDAIVERGLTGVEPLVFQESVFNAPASLISIELAIKGPVVVLPMCWTAGLHALAHGLNLLRLRRARRVLVVAADELSGATHAALDGLGFVSPNDGGQEGVRPFGGGANGAIFGEGAAALMLEWQTDAERRDATLRARISGCAIGGDGLGASPADITGRAVARVMQAALDDAHSTARIVDHVLAGTIVTTESDRAELAGIAQIIDANDRACAVTSIKPAIGELMGPAALINVIAAIGEIESQYCFGTLGLNKPAQGSIYFPAPGEPRAITSVIVNALGVSGTYGSALVEAIR